MNGFQEAALLKRLRSVMKTLSRSPVIRGVATLASGAGLAQVLSVVMTVIITRLYEPSAFGVTAVYGSFVAIGAVTASGRYDSAVILPREDEDGEIQAIKIIRLALVATLLTSVLCLLLIALAQWLGLTGPTAAIGIWKWLIPIGVLGTSTVQALQAYALRRRAYGRIGRVAPMQKLASSLIQIGLGLFHAGTLGLMTGVLVAPFVGLGSLANYFRSQGKQLAKSLHEDQLKWRLQDLRLVARVYSDFPKYQLPFALLNTASWSLQSIVLSARYSIADVGQFSLAFAVLSLPASLVASSVGSVYAREIAARAADPAECLRITRKLLKATFWVATPLCVVAAVLSPRVFPALFGSQWSLAGEIACGMAFLIWARFMGGNLSAVFLAYRRQRFLLLWQGCILASTLGSLVLGSRMGLSIVGVTWTMSVLVGALYIGLVPWTVHLLKNRMGGTTLPD